MPVTLPNSKLPQQLQDRRCRGRQPVLPSQIQKLLICWIRPQPPPSIQCRFVNQHRFFPQCRFSQCRFSQCRFPQHRFSQHRFPKCRFPKHRFLLQCRLSRNQINIRSHRLKNPCLPPLTLPPLRICLRHPSLPHRISQRLTCFLRHPILPRKKQMHLSLSCRCRILPRHPALYLLTLPQGVVHVHAPLPPNNHKFAGHLVYRLPLRQKDRRQIPWTNRQPKKPGRGDGVAGSKFFLHCSYLHCRLYIFICRIIIFLFFLLVISTK